jgi:hypothetical protein
VIQINVGDHTGDENGVPFTPIPRGLRPQVQWARTKALWISNRVSTANRYFVSLPAGRSLNQLVNDSTIWINYDPGGYDGLTFHNRDLWIGPRPFRIGRWSVLAVIIHELAHINGAAGGASMLPICGTDSPACHAAERAVLECGLGKRSEHRTNVDDPATPYDPNAWL